SCARRRRPPTTRCRCTSRPRGRSPRSARPTERPDVEDAGQALPRGIAREFRRRLCDEYARRIAHCVGRLSEAQCWQKPGPTGNSIGNLLLHLCGNIRQWILAGVRGDADRRDRPGEFAAEPGSAGARELAARLQAVAAEAAAVVDGLTAEQLLAE